MNKHINSSLSDLKLCDSKTIGYTLKAMGAGFYSLRKGTDFRKTITEVIMEGGDADRLVGWLVVSNRATCKMSFILGLIACTFSTAMLLCVEH